MTYKQRKALAYIIGVALGDGNLSNPNGRAVRLRITCDTKYPLIQADIISALTILLPSNKISTTARAVTYCDISVYSNKFNNWLSWSSGEGTKLEQKPKIPAWILHKRPYLIQCLRGLLQSDGSIYFDRGYQMVNFTNHLDTLANSVYDMITVLGYTPRLYKTASRDGRMKYTVRLARKVEDFLQLLKLRKA